MAALCSLRYPQIIGNMRSHFQRAKMSHAAVGFRIDYTFESDPSIFHDDVNGRDRIAAILLRTALIQGTIYIHSERVVPPGRGQYLDVVDYGFNAVEPPHCAFRIVLHAILYNLS